MATSAVAGQPENAVTVMTGIQEKLPEASAAVLSLRASGKTESAGLYL